MSTERTSALRAAGAARSLDAEQRARSALAALARQNEQVTFKAVATRANVSRQFLYSHGELRAEIDQARGEQRRAPQRLPARERATDDSVRARLRATLDENTRLRKEVAELREELAIAQGRVREVELAGHAAIRGS